MTITTINLIIVLVLFGAISGCASVSPRRELADIQKDIEHRTNKRFGQDFSAKVKIVVEKETQVLLQDSLTADAAVEIALFNNPSLKAAFEELGITKADLVQQGLLKNPSLHGFVREPSHHGNTNTEFEITQDILSILTLPLRTRLTGLQLEQAKYSLGKTILHFESEVRNAYYSLQAAKQMYAIQEKILNAQESAAELARRQFEAGNVNDLVMTGHQLALVQDQMDLKQREVEVKEARETLGRLMGLTIKKTDWDIRDNLPFVSKIEPQLEELEAKIKLKNFDLLMARQWVEVMEDSLKISRVNVLPEIRAGYNTEKDPDGNRLQGPAFEVEIPLFDQKLSTVTRSKAQLTQARELLKAKENEVISDARSKYARLLAAKSTAETYIKLTLPLYVKLIDSLQKQYNFMFVGVYDLLNAKKQESEAYHKFVETLKDYWILRSELELLAGEKIGYIPADSSTVDVVPKTSPHEHHNQSSHGGRNER